jgi:hypothetical protein
MPLESNREKICAHKEADQVDLPLGSLDILLGQRRNSFNDGIDKPRLLWRGQTFDVHQDHGHAFFAPLLRREFATILAEIRLTLNFEIDKCPIGQAFIHFRMGEYVFPEFCLPAGPR